MKACIIGLGNIATVHACVLNEQQIEIVDVCDVNVENAKAFMEKYCPNAKLYTDYKECIYKTTADVIHITTPHYLHKDMTVYALKLNKNVLCEKPLCISYEQLDEILTAEKSSKGKLGVCQQNRFNEASILLKKAIDGQKIKSAYGNLDWYRGENYYTSSDWRGRKDKEGGSVMINQALHTLDIMQWLLGMPEFCVAETCNLMHKGVIDTEDTATAVFLGENSFHFYASLNARTDHPINVSIEMENGDKYLMSGNDLFFNGQKQDTTCYAKMYGKSCYGSGHFKILQNFYNCVKMNKKFEIDGEEAGKVVKLILAVYKSKGEKVKV
ncbi:MAG: Gfo/Idh/MocA family oxidoreductase [Clostridia bacterium]|nr:Gfo/Idh/MocA family oxidoreductase [Clostridia bacterium]